jgi:tetratricopeptide repeat protein
LSDWLKNIIDKVKSLNNSVDKFKADTVIQSLPALTYVNRAKVLIEQNKYEEAREILLKALELPQEDALVYKYLGLVYERLGDFEKSVENYQTSADLNPQDRNIWQRLGFALISIGKYENAVKSFENSDRVQANNSDTFTGWGMALMKQHKYAEAHDKFIEAAKHNKYNFSAVFLCAVMEIKLEMYDKAEMKLTFLANVCPNANNTFEFARLKYLKKDYDSAIHYAHKSLDFNPNILPSYILLGQIYALKFDMENSLKYFETAQEKKLTNAALYLEWGKVLEKFEQFDEAILKLLKALEFEPDNIEINSYLGLCYASRKEFNEAQPLLEKVLAKEPENKIVKQALGIVAYEHDDINKALELLRADDEDAVNSYYLAKCYEKMNNDTKVKDYYENAILFNPKYIAAFTDYSRYLISRNEYPEAQRKLRKALKADENNIILLNLMFYVSYILVKENLCEYNVKETLSIAEKVENIDRNLFEYPEQKAELTAILHNNSERN